MPVWEVVEREGARRRRRERSRRRRSSAASASATCCCRRSTASRRERRRSSSRSPAFPGSARAASSPSCSTSSKHEAELTNWRQGRSLPYGEGGAFWALGEMVKAQAGILETDAAGRRAEARTKRSRAARRRAGRRWVEAACARSSGSRRGRDGRARRGVRRLAPLRRGARGAAAARARLRGPALGRRRAARLRRRARRLGQRRAAPRRLRQRGRSCSSGGRAGEAASGTRRRSRSRRSSDDDTARLLAALLDRACSPADSSRRCSPRRRQPAVRRGVRAHARRARRRATTPLPETVQGIITARLDSLPADEKELLLDAAVLGKDVLARRARRRRRRARRLHSLQRKEFVRRERRSAVAGESEYAFAPPAHPRRRVRAASARRPRGQAPCAPPRWIESLAGDRSADLAELRRAPLPRGARARRGIRRRHFGARRSRGGRAADSRSARAEALRLLAGRALCDARPRARAGRRSAAAGCAGRARCQPKQSSATQASTADGPGRRRSSSRSATSSRRAEAETIAANWLWNFGDRDGAHAAAKRAIELVPDAPLSTCETRSARRLTRAC